MTHYITISDSDVLYMDDETGNLLLPSAKLPPKLNVGEVVNIHFKEDDNNSTYISQQYTISEIDSVENLVTLDWIKQEENILVESPVIKLDSEDVVNSDGFDLSKTVARAEKEEAEAEQAAKEQEIKNKLSLKYAPVQDKIEFCLKHNVSTVDTLEAIFDDLVPSSGTAETVAGELVRAIMRLLYRDSNDGDKFFEGYGIETCASSAEYLFDNGFAEEISSMIDDALMLSSNDRKYTSLLEELAEKIIQKIHSNPELLFTVNTVDSRMYSTDYIEENQPRYEFELYASDDVCRLVEADILTSSDLTAYVQDALEYESACKDAEVERPWGRDDTTVTVTNLTKEGYDYLDDMMSHNSDNFWNDLADEYMEELDTEDEEDEDIDDNY